MKHDKTNSRGMEKMPKIRIIQRNSQCLQQQIPLFLKYTRFMNQVRTFTRLFHLEVMEQHLNINIIFMKDIWQYLYNRVTISLRFFNQIYFKRGKENPLQIVKSYAIQKVSVLWFSCRRHYFYGSFNVVFKSKKD